MVKYLSLKCSQCSHMGERTRADFFGTGMNSRNIRMPTFVYKSFFGIRKSKRTMLAHFLSNAERNIILEHAEAVYYIVNDGEGGSLPPLFWCFLPCCPPRFPASPGLTAAGLFLHPALVQGGKYLWLPGKVEHTFRRHVLNCATRYSGLICTFRAGETLFLQMQIPTRNIFCFCDVHHLCVFQDTCKNSAVSFGYCFCSLGIVFAHLGMQYAQWHVGGGRNCVPDVIWGSIAPLGGLA